jgi:hypothetical protein
MDIAAGTTFRDYFFQGLVSDPLWIMVWACVAGIVGMIAHWYKKMKIQKEGVSFMDWFVFDKLESTLIAMGTMVAGVVASIMPMEIASLSLYGAILQGFTLGFAADSAFNRVKEDTAPMDVGSSDAPKA